MSKKIIIIIIFIGLYGHSAWTQSSINISLFPEEAYTFHYYVYRIGETVDPKVFAWELPEDVPWIISITPPVETSDNCFDPIHLEIELIAPSNPGIHLGVIKDTIADQSNNNDIVFLLGVSNFISADTTWEIDVLPNEQLIINYPVYHSLSNGVGCAPDFLIDSMQAHTFSTYGNDGWLIAPQEEYLLNSSETLSVPVVINVPDTPGEYEAYLNHYREYRSFPYRIKIKLNVSTMVKIDGVDDSKPIFGVPFPNPVENYLTIPILNSSNSIIGKWEVKNALGQQIKQGKINQFGEANNLIIPTSHLPSGVYFISFLSGLGETFFTYKIIKK